MTKPSKLGAFADLGVQKPADPPPEVLGQRLPGGRGRIKPGATAVAFTMRMPIAARDELAALARRKRTSIAAWVLEACAMAAEREGVRLPLV